MLHLFRSQLICLIMAWGALITSAHAQGADALNSFLKKRADAFMVITGYSLTPDVTTGSLSITDRVRWQS
jgi:hypothetical protein